MTEYLMKCGHVSNAVMRTDKGDIPCCAICTCTEIDREVKGTEGLEGRTAKCEWCDYTLPSKWELAFFKHKPGKEHDSFYCGCGGWD